ncbi:Rho guanine nucleotide exchange factor [Marasmius tenuissimus]|nr:Rho guanine nucleotide exchange factor [Marasmius tenuissimus]
MVSLTDQQLTQHLEEVFGDEEQLRVFLEQTGENAQNWLDKLQQLTDNPNSNMTSHFRSSMFTVMIRLSKLSGQHPRNLLMQNVYKLGKHPIAAGGFGDVWKGAIRRSGSEEQLVCLKVSKVYVKSDLDALFKEYLREAIVWRQLNHPNVLPFLGIFYLKDDSQFCLISPWMDHGNLLQYLKATRRADVDHLVLVYDVAAGLAYLHGKKVVHGDLKGLNILITPEGRACIGDFGLSRIADTLALHLTTSAPRAAGTVRWLAREILNGTSDPTKESDIYAFACVCYEIYTALSPFHELPNDAAVIFHVVVSEKRPMRPVGIPELNDRMWNIMEACWNTNSAIRPKATEVLHRIKSEILVERRATRFVDRIGSKHLPQHQTSHRSPASAAHDSTQVREKDWVEPELEAVTEGRGLHEPIYSLFPLVGNKIKRSFVRPWITPLEDAELTHSDSTPQHEHPMDHGIITEGQDRAVEQGGHHSNTAKGVLIKTISSGEGLDLLLHELPVNDKHPSVDDREGSWRPQIRSKSRERTTSAASEQVKIKKERGWLSKWTNGCRDNKEVNTNGEQEELTVLIGFLTATASEDWALVLDVCERTSASETNAKEAIRALRREFKYGEPQTQLSAARLWAIMLRNSTDAFISQSISQKFLDTLENLCFSRRTNPVVRERVLDVLAAAAYASTNSE